MQLLLGIILSLILTIFHQLISFFDSSEEVKHFWYTWSFGTSIPHSIESGFKFLKISQKNVITSLIPPPPPPPDKCLSTHGIEDTNHFLFSCPFLAAQRATLASSVIQILQNYNMNHSGNQSHLYLYGHQTINFADNRKILLSTIKYIKETWRFLT